MNLRFKYLTDQIVGRPLVASLNLLAFVLGKMLTRDHALKNTKIIVVCKLMGLGSIVQITPLLAALRRGFPEARIVFLTSQNNVTYCERIEAIDETLSLNHNSLGRLFFSALAVFRSFWRMKVDLFINLEVYSNLGAILAVSSMGRNRLGYYITPRDQRAWGIYTHIVYFNRSAPVGEVYLQAARCLEISIESNDLLRPRIDSTDLASLHQKLAGLGIPDEPYIVINPNSSALCHERRWPAHYFAETIALLKEVLPTLQFLIIGSPGEESTGAEVRRHLSPSSSIAVTDLTGQLTLIDLMALLCNARAFLTNDSGPMHLAFSLAVPTVGLFGPVSPDHYGGISGASRVLLYRHLYCSPCVHHFLEAPCGGDNQCMKLIKPAEAAAALEALLSGSEPLKHGVPLRYLDHNIVFGTHRRDNRRVGF